MRVNRLATLAAVVLSIAPTGCGLFGPDTSPEEVARRFLTAFASGDTAGAAANTDSADAAKALMDSVRAALKPAAVAAELDGVTITERDTLAVATFTVRWDLGHGRSWPYQGTLRLRPDDDAWKVQWAPAVLQPELAEQQSIALREQEPDFAPVLDRDGVPLLTPERVVSVLFEPAKAGDAPAVAGQLAAVVSRFDLTITAQSIMDGAGKAPPRQPYSVVTLRDADYQQVKPQIYELPGVRFVASMRLLPVDREFAPQLLPGLRATVEDQVAGRVGWRVVTLDPAGREVKDLYTKQGEPASAVNATLSRQVQAAAEAAIDPQATPSAIVALRPSTGELLAVAQNAPADAQGAIALTGRYPPGSTFKIVTATAALRSGKVTADTPLPCPGSTTVGPRVIPNSGGFDKGTIPFHSAFAFSCNTTFAQLAGDMPADALTEAGRRLGIGVDFVVPGITTITGSVPPAGDIAERAEDGIGQGKVLVSPLGMAVAAATVAAGTMPTPSLLRGMPARADTQPAPVEPPVLDALRQMMREVVTDGTGTALAALPNVRGKTGTAQFGDGTHAHGWFIGYRDDLAFAVLVTDAGTSTPAVDAAGRFLHGVGSM